MSYSKREQQQLKNRYGEWAVVTGASSGIGKEIALRLGEAGFSLLLVARNQGPLKHLANELKERYATESITLAADLSTAEGIQAVLTESAMHPVGLLVAAAGFGSSGPLLEQDLATERNMLAVNCNAVLWMSHAFGKRFVAQGRGGIILFGSLVGFQGVPYSAHYAATKAYVQSLAEGLHHELHSTGVDVLAAAPGPVASGFAARASMNMGQALTPEQVGIPILKALGRRVTVLPGWLTKVLVRSLHLMPRAWRVRVMQSIMQNMHSPQH